MKTDRFSRRASACSVLVALLCWVMPTPALGADLTADQQTKLASAKNSLKNLETNLKLAQSSAGRGDGPVTGSKAKLAALRLDSAKQHVPPTEAALADLPADHADVKPVAEAFATAKAAIAALEARLNGGVAPPPDAGGVKLDHVQEKALSDATYYLNEAEGLANALTQLATETDAVEDKLTINHVVLNQAAATFAKANDRVGLIQGRLVELPADGRGVAAAAQRLERLQASLAASAETLNPIHAAVSDLVNPANYPQFEEDMKRLGGLAQTFGLGHAFQTNHQAAIDALNQRQPAHAELVRIVTLYKPLADQQTAQGERVSGLVSHFLEKFSAFNQAAEEQKTVLPELIRKDMAEVKKIADEAVAKQKPLFFTGGIPQILGWIDQKMELYVVLDPEPAAELAKETEALKAQVKAQEKSLGQLIINENPLPPDRYEGADRDELIEIAKDAWKHQQETFTVLGVRVPSQAWERQTKWEYSNGTWYFVDKSRVQVQLLVADEDHPQQAIIRPVNLIKNHQKADTIIGVPFYSIEEELQPRAYLLRDKIK